MQVSTSKRVILSTKEAAVILGIKPNTLEIWRIQGKSPAYLKIGKNVRYELSEIERFLDACKRTSTSDDGGRS